MMDTEGQFYLGKIFDPKQGKLTDQPLLYDPDDLFVGRLFLANLNDGFEELFISGRVVPYSDGDGNIPEPATLALLGAALAGTAVLRRRRKA